MTDAPFAKTPDWLIADFDLTAHNSFGLDARSRYGALVTDETDLSEIFAFASSRALPVRVLGGGSNVVMSPEFSGITILMSLKGRTALGRSGNHSLVEAKAGENWHDFVLWTLDNDMPGLENLAGIPGTVGAAPVQNIGAYGVELADRFDSLVAFDRQTGNFRTFDRAECRFAYRHSVFKQDPDRYVLVSVRFALPAPWKPELAYAGLLSELGEKERHDPRSIMEKVLALRQGKLPDPREMGNAGSFFHNPVVSAEICRAITATYPGAPAYPQPDGRFKLSAGWLIERCGLKGMRVGGVGVSERHALVLVNHGGGTQADIKALAGHIKEIVHTRFGVSLAEEPVFC